MILPKARVYALRCDKERLEPIGRKTLSAMLIASGPEILIMPIAPPGAVAMAQIVLLFIVCSGLLVGHSFLDEAMTIGVE